MDPLVARLEQYYDAAPRPLADAAEVGPFTLFTPRDGGHPWYARPTLGATTVTEDDVRRLLARQDELGVPRALEWVAEVSPGLLAAARGAGLEVAECPLLALVGEVPPQPDLPAGSEIRVLAADDPDLARVGAAVHVGFSGAGGVAERDELAARRGAERDAAQVARGLSVRVGAFVDPDGAVGGGSHNPRTAVPDVTEVVGLAVLAPYRRRGLGAALMAALARDALGSGIPTVFCSAQDAEVARVYAGVGLVRVGTACIVG